MKLHGHHADCRGDFTRIMPKLYRDSSPDTRFAIGAYDEGITDDGLSMGMHAICLRSTTPCVSRTQGINACSHQLLLLLPSCSPLLPITLIAVTACSSFIIPYVP